jgi:hypothetical protein
VAPIIMFPIEASCAIPHPHHRTNMSSQPLDECCCFRKWHGACASFLSKSGKSHLNTLMGRRRRGTSRDTWTTRRRRGSDKFVRMMESISPTGPDSKMTTPQRLCAWGPPVNLCLSWIPGPAPGNLRIVACIVLSITTSII